MFFGAINWSECGPFEVRIGDGYPCELASFVASSFCRRKKRRDVVAPLCPLGISSKAEAALPFVHSGHTPLASLAVLSARKRRAWLVAAGGAYCAGPGTDGHHAAVYVYVGAGHE